MTRNLQVLLVDMDPDHRAMIKQQLANLPYAIVGEANYGVEASRLAMELHPDIVLLHVEEPLALAFRTLEVVQQADPAAVPIVISKLGDADSARKAMLAGARGYIVSPCSEATLNDVLSTAHARRPVGAVVRPDEPSLAPVAGSIITVFGPKGGIGKTTLSTNLAIALKKHTSTRVVLVDIDAYFGDVAVMLGMDPERSLLDIIAESTAHDEFPKLESYLTEHRSGLQVLAARHPGDVGASPDPELIARILKTLARSFDFVVVDTPGAFGPQVAAALDESTTVLLVTTVDIASIKDARFSLDTLRGAGFGTDRLKLVVNHATNANSVTDADVARTVNYEVSWVLPHDSAVPISTQHGDPVMMSNPKALMARKVDSLASFLSGGGASPQGQDGSRRRGLFKRNS